MSAREWRAATGLAGIFGLRMFGLFAILPVFAVYATTLQGGLDLRLVGIALGAYGLAQAVLQIPFGMWSDRIGRKPALYAGLAVFAAGSFLAAWADSIYGVIAGRAVQGAGAISAVAIAMAADLTRDEHRTKTMAVIGSMIGIAFALSLVLGPWLGRHIGVAGIFALIGILAIVAMAVVVSLPDPERAASRASEPARLRAILADAELNRLNAGIFVLHAVLTAQFVTVPFDLRAAGMAVDSQWQLYAAVMLAAAVLMLPGIRLSGRKGVHKPVFLVSIALLGLGQLLLIALGGSVVGSGVALAAFFTGFMILEAALPAHVSRTAPPAGRGAAIAVYSTLQYLGAFFGGALGGVLLEHFGRISLLAANLLLLSIWFGIALNMRIIAASSTRGDAPSPVERDRSVQRRL